MNYLPLVHSSSVYVGEKPVFSGTLGQAIRWMRQQPSTERPRFNILVQNHRDAISFEEIEMIARRTGTLGDTPSILTIAA
jgi:hypothetical protein